MMLVNGVVYRATSYFLCLLIRKARSHVTTNFVPQQARGGCIIPIRQHLQEGKGGHQRFAVSLVSMVKLLLLARSVMLRA